MDKMLEHAMSRGSKKEPKPRHLKEFHAKEQSDGKYHVRMDSGKPNDSAKEESKADMSQVAAALEDHMGQPNEGEAQAEAAAPQPGMGAAPAAAASMGAGQPGMGGM
jgi:hypothetical protein